MKVLNLPFKFLAYSIIVEYPNCQPQQKKKIHRRICKFISFFLSITINIGNTVTEYHSRFMASPEKMIE